MTSVAQQLPVSLTPVDSAGHLGAHRAAPAPRASRIRPWVHRGLAVGTLAAGLWLAGSLSQAPAAEAAASGAVKPHVVSSTGDAPASLGALGAGSTAGHSSRAPAVTKSAPISHISQGKAHSTGPVAAGAAGGLGTQPPARSDAAGATPPTGSGAARRPVSTVVNAAADLTRTTRAVPVPAAPVLRTPTPVIPALPAVSLPGPAAIVPAVLAPALPVVPARPAEPARALPAHQPTALPAPAATGRNHGWSSDSASVDKPAGHHLIRRPIHATEISPAPPQQLPTPPAGHRPSTVPGRGLGGGHHPLDSGLAPTDLSSPGVKPAGDCRSRDHTPPRERASAPSTSPD